MAAAIACRLRRPVLAALAMLKTGQFNDQRQSVARLSRQVEASQRHLGHHPGDHPRPEALLAGMGGGDLKDDVHFTIKLNGAEAVRGKIGKNDADVMQSFDLKGLEPDRRQPSTDRGQRRNQPDVSDRQPALRAVAEAARAGAARDGRQGRIRSHQAFDQGHAKAKATLKYNGKTADLHGDARSRHRAGLHGRSGRFRRDGRQKQDQEVRDHAGRPE